MQHGSFGRIKKAMHRVNDGIHQPRKINVRSIRCFIRLGSVGELYTLLAWIITRTEPYPPCGLETC